MKRCDYCGKEISYHLQYCCDECSENALNFYKNEKRFKNIFGFINVISIVSLMIACFIALLFSAKIALITAGIALLVMGIGVFSFPMPTLNQLKKQKIKKAIFSTRIIGIILAVLGIVLFIFGILN